MKKLSDVVPAENLAAVTNELLNVERDVRMSLKIEIKGKSIGWIEMELRARDL